MRFFRSWDDRPQWSVLAGNSAFGRILGGSGRAGRNGVALAKANRVLHSGVLPGRAACAAVLSKSSWQGWISWFVHAGTCCAVPCCSDSTGGLRAVVVWGGVPGGMSGHGIRLYGLGGRLRRRVGDPQGP
ncbi:hypothetical protein F4560_008586 [Saccharothrix ecbatanensis]|uniref:Uncharacterized protein n=1 Tax=Saccharothrix ecbatanensis TaxID=1105145 RepID=A0A7W9HUQ6_9PSEU|nr:hypothetical protein [Saccharothrix ecbatanensis]